MKVYLYILPCVSLFIWLQDELLSLVEHEHARLPGSTKVASESSVTEASSGADTKPNAGADTKESEKTESTE